MWRARADARSSSPSRHSRQANPPPPLPLASVADAAVAAAVEQLPLVVFEAADAAATAEDDAAAEGDAVDGGAAAPRRHVAAAALCDPNDEVLACVHPRSLPPPRYWTPNVLWALRKGGLRSLASGGGAATLDVARVRRRLLQQ